MRFFEPFVANNSFKLLGELWSSEIPLRATSDVVLMTTYWLDFTSPSHSIEYCLGGISGSYGYEYKDDCLLHLSS
jgi:hypothetical protein